MEWTVHHAHPWDVSPAEAVALQRELARLVREEPLPPGIRTVAGIDVSIRAERAYAAIAVVQLPGLEVVDRATHEMEVPFPYVPGLLSFREIPAILPALAKLRIRPDVLMTDSQGRAHPRRCGLACHLGVLLDWPAVGVAKSVLVGVFDPPASERGAQAPMRHRGEVVGLAVRTRDRVQPVYVSAGHRATLADAAHLALACAAKYRLPEPTRQAHLLSRAA